MFNLLRIVSRRWTYISPALVCALVAGCSTTVTTGSSPPPPEGCSVDGSLLCISGATGYSCTGVAHPNDTNASLNCSDGVADGALTDYCCFTFSNTTTCADDPSVAGCAPGSFGFSCNGNDTPEEADSSLNCSVGVPGNTGETLYCCQ